MVKVPADARRTNGLGSSEKGGEDHVAQPSGTGPVFDNVWLKATKTVSSLITSTELPSGRPEKSIFVVAARYSASGLSIGVAAVVTPDPAALMAAKICASSTLVPRFEPRIFVSLVSVLITVHLLLS